MNRRTLLRGGLSATILLGQARSVLAEKAEPPAFFTARSQFVFQEPQTNLSNVALRRPDGSFRAISSFAGKALLINFWASWCEPCRRELPILARLQGQAPQEPFEIAPVSIDKEPSHAEFFLRERGLRRLKTFFDPVGLLASSEAAGFSPFRLIGLPMSFLIDRSGMLVGYVVGEADWSSEAGVSLLRFYGRP